MKIKQNYGLLLLCLFCFSCACSKTNKASVTATINSLSAADLQPFGRYRLTANQSLEMISSAVHFGFSFEGKQCELFASIADANGHNYLQYEMDGVYQKRIRIEGSNNEPVVLTAPAEGTHTVWIYKATEATTGPIFIQKVNGKNIKPLANPAAPLIEFIGNSITCGAQADLSEVPCGQGVYHDRHNAYLAYGPRVARALGVNYILSSVSGIGIYRTWNMDGPSMPQVYENTDLQMTADKWDFSKYTPRIVSIALGTNDLSNGDGVHARSPFDSAVFVNGYIAFIRLVKSKYRQAQIALLSSPLVGSKKTLLENCLIAVKQKTDAAYPDNKPLALHFFPAMQVRGCGHPSTDDHAIMAEELLPFFKKLLQ